MTKKEIKALDTLWSEAVKLRAKYRCEYCGAAGIKAGGNTWLNSCHIVGRRFRGLRWDIENGMSLCYVHHHAYDSHLPQHEDIRKEVIGEDRIKRLLEKKHPIAKYQDYEEIEKILRRKIGYFKRQAKKAE